jgi:two-component system OmpR family sensor kinase
LQDSFLRQQRFTGDASHQLRTPLTVILGQIEVTLRRDRSAEEYRRVLSLVHERSTHLKNIVESLLFLARADGDALAPEYQIIELNSFLQNFVSSFSDHERFADLKCDIQRSDECRINSHPTLLQELLSILVDNAFKFSKPGTPVVIGLAVDATSVAVSICDCGQGIAPRDIRHLGESFFRTETAKQHGTPGIGLGLSIARRLSTTHAASISFASEIGNGTTATVRVPRQQKPSMS